LTGYKNKPAFFNAPKGLLPTVRAAQQNTVKKTDENMIVQPLK
jgi:hypothetical protein